MRRNLWDYSEYGNLNQNSSKVWRLKAAKIAQPDFPKKKSGCQYLKLLGKCRKLAVEIWAALWLGSTFSLVLLTPIKLSASAL